MAAMDNFVMVSEAAQHSIYSAYHIRYLLRQGLVKGRNIGVWLVDLDDLKRYEVEMDAKGPKKFDPTKSHPSDS